MQYVRLAVPQELYESLGFCPEMALLPSSDMKSIKIVPFSCISQVSNSSDLNETSDPSELQSNTLAPFTEKSDKFEENPSHISSDLDTNNQTDLCNDNSVEDDETPAIGVEKSDENRDAPPIGIRYCRNTLPDHGYQGIEDSVEESNIFGDNEERESPQEKILDPNKTLHESVSISDSLGQECTSTDKVLVDSLLDHSSQKIEKAYCLFQDPVSWEESNIDRDINDSPESTISADNEPDCANASEDHLNSSQNSKKAIEDELQSDCERFPSPKKRKVEPQSSRIPFIKVCDNCCRTYQAIKTFQRHKKNCEKYKADLVSGKVRKARGSCSSGPQLEKDLIYDLKPKGSKTIDHLIWKKGPLADITCDKCHWKFFSIYRYEKHLTQCKTLQTRGAGILDNSVEKDKTGKWFHAPSESTKKAQHYFVLRK